MAIQGQAALLPGSALSLVFRTDSGGGQHKPHDVVTDAAFDQPHPVHAVVYQVSEGQPHAFADLRKCCEVEHGMPRTVGENGIKRAGICKVSHYQSDTGRNRSAMAGA